MAPFPLRDRTDGDRAAVAGLLLATHHSDAYPVSLPDDLEAWGMATDVVRAWVAVDPTEGDEVVGHVVLADADDGTATEQWVAATGRPPADLVAVRRLVVHARAQGTGTGRALLATAVEAAHALGRRPVLDMADNLRGAAGALYESAGFELVDAYDLPLPGHLLHVLTYVGPPPPD